MDTAALKKKWATEKFTPANYDKIDDQYLADFAGDVALTIDEATGQSGVVGLASVNKSNSLHKAFRMLTNAEIKTQGGFGEAFEDLIYSTCCINTQVRIEDYRPTDPNTPGIRNQVLVAVFDPTAPPERWVHVDGSFRKGDIVPAKFVPIDSPAAQYGYLRRYSATINDWAYGELTIFDLNGKDYFATAKVAGGPLGLPDIAETPDWKPAAAPATPTPAVPTSSGASAALLGIVSEAAYFTLSEQAPTDLTEYVLLRTPNNARTTAIPGDNLLDPSAASVLADTYLSSYDGSPQALAGWKTAILEIIAGQQYYHNLADPYTWWLDKDQQALQKVVDTAGLAPALARYAAGSRQSAAFGEAMFLWANPVPATYQAYWPVLLAAHPTGQPYAGQVFGLFGDSLTLQQTYVANLLSSTGAARAIVQGFSGEVFRTGTDLLPAGIFDPAGLIQVMLGTNEFGHGENDLGQLGDPATAKTIYGAVRYCYEKLRAQYPAKPIYFVTPTERGAYGSEPVSPAANPHGLTIQSIATAIKTYCASVGVAVYDLNATSDITPANAASKTQDGLHWSNATGAAIGTQLGAFVNEQFAAAPELKPLPAGATLAHQVLRVPLQGMTQPFVLALRVAGQLVPLATVTGDLATQLLASDNAFTGANTFTKQLTVLDVLVSSVQNVALNTFSKLAAFVQGLVSRLGSTTSADPAATTSSVSNVLSRVFGLSDRVDVLAKQIIRWDQERRVTLVSGGGNPSYTSGQAFVVVATTTSSSGNQFSLVAQDYPRQGDYIGLRVRADSLAIVVKGLRFGSPTGPSTFTCAPGQQYTFHGCTDTAGDITATYWQVHTAPSSGTGSYDDSTLKDLLRFTSSADPAAPLSTVKAVLSQALTLADAQSMVAADSLLPGRTYIVDFGADATGKSQIVYVSALQTNLFNRFATVITGSTVISQVLVNFRNGVLEPVPGGGASTFAQLGGAPRDNAALATELDAVNSLTDGRRDLVTIASNRFNDIVLERKVTITGLKLATNTSSIAAQVLAEGTTAVSSPRTGSPADLMAALQADINGLASWSYYLIRVQTTPVVSTDVTHVLLTLTA